MIDLSPGLALAGFDMLKVVDRQALNTHDVIEGLRRVSGMPAGAVLQLVQTLNWVAVSEDGRLGVTAAGHRIVGSAGYPAMLRLAILDYAEIVSPPWLQNAPFGRARVLMFAPPGAGQSMVEAGLAEGTSDEIVAFWDALAGLARGRRDAHLAEIGRRGERLTIQHETVRTGTCPRWVAIDSNEDGYDVLSVWDHGDDRPLAIEVKSSTVGLAGSFFISRGEWDIAQSRDAHLFHLWDLSAQSAPRLAVISADSLDHHVPVDRGEGVWTTIEVPFAAFADRFAA